MTTTSTLRTRVVFGLVLVIAGATGVLYAARAARPPTRAGAQLRWLPSSTPDALAYTVWRCAGEAGACPRPAGNPEPGDPRWRVVAEFAAADVCKTNPCTARVDDPTPPPVSYIVTTRTAARSSEASNVLSLGPRVAGDVPPAR